MNEAKTSLGSLGRYVLLRELGRGAYGTVYLARDEVLDVPRAVKVLHPAWVADATLVERFHQEAKLAARLEHPHIVPVYDFGEAEGGRLYLAMRYMPGGSLKERLEAEGPLPWDEVVRIVKQVAAGLAYAHEQGVVHRDLKPGNILFDKEGRAAVTDLGFAKALSGAGNSLSLTATGGLIGTPPYMAPELWKNKGVGPAVDQYALACIVVEMLTGKVLFAGETPPEVMVKHVLEEPPLPETWPEGVPEGVDAVLRKALAKEPGERYGGVSSFIVALSRMERQITAGKEEQSVVGFPYEVPEKRQHSRPPYWLMMGRTRWRQPIIMKGHTDWVNSVAFSPDGELLISGSEDTTVRLWRVADATLVRILDGYDVVDSVVFSPDGTMLAAGVEDNTVRLWATLDGTLLRAFDGHSMSVFSVAFSPDSTLLASGGEDGAINLWRLSDGRLVRTLEGHKMGVLELAFSPDGALLASGGEDGAINLWRLSDGALVHSFEEHKEGVFGVAFSPDGVWLASGSEDKTVLLWRVADGALERRLEGAAEGISDVAFSPDGKWLVAGAWDGKVYLWRMVEGRLANTLDGHNDGVLSVAFSPDGTLLASGSADGAIVLWPREAWAAR